MRALSDAFNRAGISPGLTELRVALSKFINQGGTTAQIRAEVDAIDRMPGMGLNHDADGLEASAQTRQPVEDGGAKVLMPQGRAEFAPSSSSHHDERGHRAGAQPGHMFAAPSRRVPDRGGEGQAHRADIGHILVALPVREPSRTQRGLSSIKLVQSTIRKGLLELRKTSDGRAWGSVGWHELEGMDRDGAIARLIKAGVNPPKNQHAELRSFLSNKQFEEICNAAKTQNDFV